MAPDTERSITSSSATELARNIREGHLTATDAVEAHLHRIADRDDELNAFITVLEDAALEAAAEADRTLEAGDDVGPLHGVPIALKDLGALKAGVRHTFGCDLFSSFVAPRTAAIVERLESAGAIVIGKTNTPEFGHAGTTHNNLIGTTGSPIDPSLNAGGSSGGSAAAVGAGMVPVATGSDAGGSLRIPATACGIYAIKPTYGLVPNDSRPNGFGTHLHHSTKGPMSRTVEDAARLLEVMAGPHPMDPECVPVDLDYLDAAQEPDPDVSIAYSPDLEVFPVVDEVVSVVEGALEDLEAAGATIDRVSVDHGCTHEELTGAVETTFSSAIAGGVAVLESTYGVDVTEYPDHVASSFLRLADRGAEVSAADVAETGVERTKVFDAVQDVLASYDLLVTPTVARADIARDADVSNEWDLALTWPFNWTGHPAASVPAGLTDDGGPVGLQLVGQRFGDETVLAGSALLERERPWEWLYGFRESEH